MSSTPSDGVTVDSEVGDKTPITKPNDSKILNFLAHQFNEGAHNLVVQVINISVPIFYIRPKDLDCDILVTFDPNI